MFHNWVEMRYLMIERQRELLREAERARLAQSVPAKKRNRRGQTNKTEPQNETPIRLTAACEEGPEESEAG